MAFFFYMPDLFSFMLLATNRAILVSEEERSGALSTAEGATHKPDELRLTAGRVNSVVRKIFG